MKFLYLILLLVFLISPAFAAPGNGKKGDGARSFQYSMKLLETTEGYRLYRVTYPSPKPPFWESGKMVKAFYFEPIFPEGVRSSPRPAVLCLHILGGGGSITKTIAGFFASHGMPALMPMMPLFLERRPRISMDNALRSANGPLYLAEALEAVPGDITRSLNFLASRPEVDVRHMNVIGTSLGGILAVSTAGRDRRIEKAIFLLAGGGLQEILSLDIPEVTPMREAFEAADPEMRRRLLDAYGKLEPMAYAKKLSQKGSQGQIRMYCAELDQVVPPENSLKLAEAMGLTKDEDFIVIPGVDHYTAIANLPNILDESLAFFLGDEVPLQNFRQNSSFGEEEKKALQAFFLELNRLFACEPAPGEQIQVAMNLRISERGKESLAGTLSLDLDGEHYRVSLTDWRGLGEIACASFGRGETPWVVSSDGTLFLGDETLVPDFLPLLSPQIVGYRQMALLLSKNIATMGSLQVLEQLAGLTHECRQGESLELLMECEGWEAVIRLKDGIPQGIGLTDGDIDVQIDFTQWNTHAPADLLAFQPPEASGNVFTVNSDDLVRSLVAVLAHGLTTLVIK